MGYPAGTRQRALGYLWLAGWLAPAAGCGFFDLREAVPPVVPVVIPNRPWSSADNVLYNLEQAIRYKQDGLLQYEESLSEEGFLLILDPTDVGDLGQGTPPALSRPADVEAHRRLVNAVSDSFYFVFGQTVPDERDTLVFYDDLPYELLFIGPAGDTVGRAAGLADLYVKEVRAARWAVSIWEDHRTTGAQDTARTFGYLHGERAAGP